MLRRPSRPSDLDGAYWVSCERFTVLVEVVGGRIIRTAPVTRMFLGQHPTNLRRWFEQWPPVRISRLAGPDGVCSGLRTSQGSSPQRSV